MCRLAPSIARRSMAAGSRATPTIQSCGRSWPTPAMPTRRGPGDEGECDLVLNLKTPKRLGLSFPLSLLGRAEALLQVLTNNTYRFKRIGLEAGPLSQW